jgi:hypothetical protein
VSVLRGALTRAGRASGVGAHPAPACSPFRTLTACPCAIHRPSTHGHTRTLELLYICSHAAATGGAVRARARTLAALHRARCAARSCSAAATGLPLPSLAMAASSAARCAGDRPAGRVLQSASAGGYGGARGSADITTAHTHTHTERQRQSAIPGQERRRGRPRPRWAAAGSTGVACGPWAHTATCAAAGIAMCSHPRRPGKRPAHPAAPRVSAARRAGPPAAACV